MLTAESLALVAAAASTGFIHTLVGPDHYLPFVAMGRSRQWSMAKTLSITFLCGLGHVASSVVLGLVGLGLGLAVFRLENLESIRGTVAGWLLLAFGLVYLIWGIRHAIRNQPHTHVHVHANGLRHSHEHVHADAHLHPHASQAKPVTPWVLFVIFVLGPCEPLIPLFIYPAASDSIAQVVLVTAAFAIATLTAMLASVAILFATTRSFRLPSLERYGHAAAGFVVACCGVAVTVGL